MIKIIKKILLRNSPCRSLQKIESEKFKLKVTCLEIGNTDYNKKSFFNDFKLHKNHNLFFADILKIKKKNYFRLNLEKKNILRKKFDTIIIFNVLEHVYDINNALKEIKKILKPKGKIIISTPFIYRYHQAPKDYNRYTLDFYEVLAKSHNLKIYYKKNLGTGPFFASYSIIHNVINLFKPLNLIPLALAIVLDKTIGFFFKKIPSLYPICNFVIFKNN